MKRCRTMLAWLVLAAAGGCSAASSPGTALDTGTLGAERETSSREVMVTLPPAPEEQLSRAAFELQQRYRLELVNAWDLEVLGARCLVLRIAGDMPRPLVLKLLQSDSRVALAQPVQWFEVLQEQEQEPEPYRHLQYGAEALNLTEAHRYAQGRGVTVAVVDTGMDIVHPDLEGRVAVARSFVRSGRDSFGRDIHGTAVAGVIAAARNGVGIIGVAPQAQLMALKACWQAGRAFDRAVCNSYTLALALDYAIAHGARVVNLSLTGPEDPILAELIRMGCDRGVLMVAAAASAGTDRFPASMACVLGVYAVSPDSTPEETRRFGGMLGGPGVDILTTVPGGSWDFLSGASFAAAHVSGVSALVLERRPGLEPGRLAALLLESMSPADDPPAVIDAVAALRGALGEAVVPAEGRLADSAP